MSRLVFDLLPEEMPQRSRRVLDAAFRSLLAVLDSRQGGIRMREQFAGVVDVVVDTAVMPVALAVPLKRPPISVLLLGATVQRSPTGRVISGGAVDWEWRNGGVLVHDIDGLAATTRYDVTLAVLE